MLDYFTDTVATALYSFPFCRVIRATICRENCEDKMEAFLKRCFYHSGQYNSEEDFEELDKKLKEKEVFAIHT